MDTLIKMNAGLAGFFAFAAIHYAVQWWLSRRERVLLVFAGQCTVYATFSLAISSFFQARTILESQSALDWMMTVAMFSHALLLQFYADLGGRRDRAFRALITGVLAFLAILNQWAPLRGTVLELQSMPLPWGGTGLLAIRTPPGASLALLYLVVLAIQSYGFFVARTLWKRDRAGAVFVAIGAAAILAGFASGFLVDYAKVRVPYAGALPHAINVLCLAFFLSREYAARGARVAASEKRAEHSLREAQHALANLKAEQLRREESEAARHRAMEAVVQVQRQELAGQLAAGVAHDFNNVLNVISLWSQVLVGASVAQKDQEKARRALADAQAQGRALSRQLMALARPESRSVKRFPLDRPIRTTVQTLTPALPRGVQITSEVTNAPEVEADETEIQQVIYNLVLNARDAMSAGGAIAVTGGVETSPNPVAVAGGSLAAGRWATLSVTDSGPGIDPSIRDRIFDLFFTTKGPGRGTGLGLATVLRIAKGSGGGVALESTPGHGATFKIYLPVYEASIPGHVREGESRGVSSLAEASVASDPPGR